MRSQRRRILTLAALVLLPAAAYGETMPHEGGQPVRITRETFRGWEDAYRLSNGRVDAVVVTAIGPRIMAFGPTDGPSLFYVRDREAGGRNEQDWTFRGGWRLWVAPERRETTYSLDNAPCTAEVSDTTLRVTGPPQPDSGLQKTIEVSLDAEQPRLHLVSHLRNIGDRPRTYAAWSLSVLRPGGRAFVPFDVGPPDSFDAIRRLILWSYTKIHDPRYRFGDRLIQIDHAMVAAAPQGAGGRRDDESKIGVDSAQGWGAYLLDGTLYVKRFGHDADGQYPDGGATIEVYSSAEFLELEQLGPLTTIQPGAEIVFPEDWWLFSNVTVPAEEAPALEALGRYVK